jgi:hypothetical protein
MCVQLGALGFAVAEFPIGSQQPRMQGCKPGDPGSLQFDLLRCQGYAMIKIPQGLLQVSVAFARRTPPDSFGCPARIEASLASSKRTRNRFQVNGSAPRAAPAVVSAACEMMPESWPGASSMDSRDLAPPDAGAGCNAPPDARPLSYNDHGQTEPFRASFRQSKGPRGCMRSCTSKPPSRHVGWQAACGSFN